MPRWHLIGKPPFISEVGFDFLPIDGGYGIDNHDFAHFSVKSIAYAEFSADLIEYGRTELPYYPAVLKTTVDRESQGIIEDEGNDGGLIVCNGSQF